MEFNDKICRLHMAFLHQANDLTPTDEEYVGWVDSHLVAVRPGLYRLGPRTCWLIGSASFQAWVLESRGVSIDEYMAKHLSAADYLRWVERFATPTLAPDGPNLSDYELPIG